MKKYKICILVTIFLLIVFSCKENTSNEIISIVEKWNNREIIYPHHVSFTILGEDTIQAFPVQGNKYSILTYVDSIGCMSCKLQLREWMAFIDELDSQSKSSIPVYFFLRPKNKKEMINILKRDQFRYPVCIDEQDSLNALNHFPDAISFNTFLLDQNNRVIAMGNPILNSQIKKLYFSILFGEQKRNDASSFKTKIVISDSVIDMGRFSWNEENKNIVVVKNTGNFPLIINNITTSCGCTSIEYDKSPVTPQDSITINIIYKAEHPGHFNKTITMYCNTENSPLRLNISGNAQ